MHEQQQGCSLGYTGRTDTNPTRGQCVQIRGQCVRHSELSLGGGVWELGKRGDTDENGMWKGTGQEEMTCIGADVMCEFWKGKQEEEIH